MKKLALLVLCCSPIFSMQLALVDALKNDAVDEVEEVLEELVNPTSQQLESHASAALLRRDADLNEIQKFSGTLLDQKKQNAGSRNNFDFYKRMLLGAGTAVSALAPVGFSLYDAYTTGHHFPANSIFISLAIAAAAGSFHALEQCKLGFSNHDAKIKYDKHRVMAYLIAEAKARQQRQEPIQP